MSECVSNLLRMVARQSFHQKRSESNLIICAIENFLAKLEQYWGIATRFDNRSRNFLGAIDLAATVMA